MATDYLSRGLDVVKVFLCKPNNRLHWGAAIMHTLSLQEDNPDAPAVVDKSVNPSGLSEDDITSGGWWSAKVGSVLPWV